MEQDWESRQENPHFRTSLVDQEIQENVGLTRAALVSPQMWSLPEPDADSPLEA